MVVFSSSYEVSIRYIAVLGFQPQSRHRTGAAKSRRFPSAISRYLVSNAKREIPRMEVAGGFPSAISRYLVSNPTVCMCLVTGRICFHPLYRGTWFPTFADEPVRFVFNEVFPSAISRYLVSNPTRKTPPLTSGGGNDLHTPRRIDHIPTFASLNHDKNTRSTHYTPNAGIEFSQAGFAPPTR